MIVNRAVLYRLYKVIWVFLRVCIVVVLLPLFVVIVQIGAAAWQNRNRVYVPPDPVVCGKMAGEVYRFPRVYFPFWPEYEGKSSFEPGFIENKKGCDANLVSVFMAMTWPGLEPAEDRLIFEQGLEHEGLLIGISPIVARQGDLPMLKDHWLSQIPKEAAARVEYDSLLRLYRVEGFAVGSVRGRKMYLWSEEEGRITSLTECLWRPRKPNFYTCKMNFVVFDQLIVDVAMLPEKLGQWSTIKSEVELFLTESKTTR